jgi:hypothetical protein
MLAIDRIEIFSEFGQTGVLGYNQLSAYSTPKSTASPNGSATMPPANVA